MDAPSGRPVTFPDGSRFFQGDCIEVARTLPDASVDLIVTDPPYGIDGANLHQHYNRDEGFVVAGYVEVPAEEYARFSQEWVREAARLLKPGGSIYIVSGYTHLFEVLAALRKTDLQEVNHIVWKYNFGVHTRRKYVSSHYHILFYVKPGAPHTFNLESRFGLGERGEGGGAANYRDREDVWTINREYKPGRKKNKNELPTELLAKMIQYSSDPGDTVADLFLGGGSTARVAIGLGRKALGIEKSRATFRHAVDRLAQVPPGDLRSQMRRPVLADPGNRGKPWTETDYAHLRARLAELRRQGVSKARTIEILGEELGRGRFALLRAMERLEAGATPAASKPRRRQITSTALG